MRQLDIAGVDEKFIETRKGLLAELLAELLDQVLPACAIDAEAVGARQFEARYGLLSKPALIRFRLLDPAAYIGGLSDLAVPVAQFCKLRPDVRHVFIISDKDVIYWGDIDTHGFAILDRLRGKLPHARTILMDAATLREHQALWGSEELDERFVGTLSRLTGEERACSSSYATMNLVSAYAWSRSGLAMPG